MANGNYNLGNTFLAYSEDEDGLDDGEEVGSAEGSSNAGEMD